MDVGSDPKPAHTRGRGSAPAVLLALIYVAALPYRTAVESKIQHDIEDKVRIPAGDYLGQVVKPGQTVKQSRRVSRV